MLKTMNVLKWVLITSSVVFMAAQLGACGTAIPVPTATEGAAVAPSFLSSTPPTTSSSILTNTLSPQVKVQFAITPNFDQLSRWREYERALASKLLFLHPPGDVICEWEFLGQSGQEEYVWAFCLGLPPVGMDEKYAPGASIPAVIHLEQNGSIQSVELPRDGGLSYAEGIRKIFPKDVQERIFGRLVNIDEMIAHARLRRKSPAPPLIVLLSTPQP
jgi:hypothetical protein